MNLSALINIFKQQDQLNQKCLSVFGKGAYSIKGMEQSIENGFTSENLVFGAFNTVTKKEWEYAHVELVNGQFKVSSDMPHTGIEDIYVTDEGSAIKAVCSILNQLIS